uniref:Uncharacterized protein n=1 Tax=Romanomermis culicivorax TaxID=13658 RepID=A0A915HSI0_ROMCU
MERKYGEVNVMPGLTSQKVCLKNGKFYDTDLLKFSIVYRVADRAMRPTVACVRPWRQADHTMCPTSNFLVSLL